MSIECSRVEWPSRILKIQHQRSGPVVSKHAVALKVDGSGKALVDLLEDRDLRKMKRLFIGGNLI